jgi:hypothetical protein
MHILVWFQLFAPFEGQTAEFRTLLVKFFKWSALLWLEESIQFGWSLVQMSLLSHISFSLARLDSISPYSPLDPSDLRRGTVCSGCGTWLTAVLLQFLNKWICLPREVSFTLMIEVIIQTSIAIRRAHDNRVTEAIFLWEPVVQEFFTHLSLALHPSLHLVLWTLLFWKGLKINRAIALREVHETKKWMIALTLLLDLTWEILLRYFGAWLTLRRLSAHLF